MLDWNDMTRALAMPLGGGPAAIDGRTLGSAEAGAGADRGIPAWLALLPWVLGLSALLLPTYWRLHETLWNDDAYEHGLVIVALFWWLIWRMRGRLAELPKAPAASSGFLLLAAGLLLYHVGRTQHLPLFEVAAHLPILAGCALLAWGPASLRVLWFPLLFLVFMVPMPGFVMVALTAELKQQVSVVAEALLYHAGYPIARDGVVISIGQYRMLVADACSGLNSIYSLSAMGLLYLHLTHRPGWLRLGLLLASIVPIAFFANVLRVIVLILLTHHFGDEAGQGFLHNASGVMLFVAGLLCLLALDAVLRRLFGEPPARMAEEPLAATPGQGPAAAAAPSAAAAPTVARTAVGDTP